MSVPRTRTTTSNPGLKHGFRSGLEQSVAIELADHYGRIVPYEAKESVINYTPPCQQRRYTPDFMLPNGIFLETKGRFVTADRMKHLHIKAEHPDIDIRFIFSNSRQRISKTSKTTYADWCLKHGFQFADKHVPKEWLNERAA
jgi:hypothetical protein